MPLGPQSSLGQMSRGVLTAVQVEEKMEVVVTRSMWLIHEQSTSCLAVIQWGTFGSCLPLG